MACLVSCSDNGVEQKFNAINQMILEGPMDSVYTAFDEESHEYLKDLLQLAQEKNIAGAEFLGRRLNIPISTLVLYEYLQAPGEESNDSTEELYQSETLLKFILQLTQVGIFRTQAGTPLRFHELEYSNSSSAAATIAVPTGNGPFILTTFQFHREGDEWKLNFPSTMGVMEKIYAQGQRASLQTSQEYARTIKASTAETFNFKYRTYLQE